MIPWTVALQAPLSVKFSRQEYWSELSLPSSGHLPDLGIEPCVSCISCSGRWILIPLSILGSPGLCLPLANYLVSFFTPDWSLNPPQDAWATFSKMDPTAEACGWMSILIMGWGTPPFRPPRSLPAHVQTGDLFLDLRRASLFTLAELSFCHQLCPWSV